MNLFKKKAPEKQTPVKAGLTFLCELSDKRKYYTFKPDSGLSVDRLMVLYPLLEHMALGVAGHEMAELLDQIMINTNALVTAEKKEAKNALGANTAALISIAKGRTNNSFHHKLILAMAGLWTIREDEDPAEYNQQIQSEKEALFAAECREGSASAFFQKIRFSGLPDLSRLSEDALNELWTNSINQVTLLQSVFADLINDKQRHLLQTTSRSN